MGPQHHCCGVIDRRADMIMANIELQWGRNITVAEWLVLAEGEEVQSQSFNGAATSLLRSENERLQSSIDTINASMGPQHHCCGVRFVET